MDEMTFRLFNKISFEVSAPIALIEAFCFQSDFYSNYDVVPVAERKMQHVNRIGARINKELLPRAQTVVKETSDLNLFQYDDSLDRFLQLDSEKMRGIVDEFNEKAVKGLLTKGIGLSKATKILHTFHPETVPMIDNPLQKLYSRHINSKWIEGEPGIFVDYYNNFRESFTWRNLKLISQKLRSTGLTFTEVRVFDILWWSCLKSVNLNNRLDRENRKTIDWLTLQIKGL
jgi:hypothetical protein